MMPMASVGSVASMPQQLTHINTDSFFIKVWGIVEKEKADFIRDMIDVYTTKLVDGFGQLRSLSELIAGKIVLAFYDNRFQRAEIVRLDGAQTRKVIVFLIDLGVMTSVDVNEIRIADGIFSTVPRNGLAEDFILDGVVAKRQWTSQEAESVNLCLRHCSEISLTGIVGDKKIIQVIMSMNASRINLSSFLVEGGLADTISEDQLTNILRNKYGKTTTNTSSTSQFSVPPPSIPNVPIPSSFAAPQQTTIRGPSVTPSYTNETSQSFVPPAYQRIRVPKPVQNMHSVASVQSYVYPTLPVDSTHDVVVSHVIDGMNAFTVQLRKSTDVELPKLMAKINDIRPVPFTEQIGPGALCLGRFVQDNSLCRAVVSNVLAEGASLYFVDFGNTEIVPFDEIYRIPPEFLQEPTMALRFALADLTSNYSLTTTEAHGIFTQLVLQEDHVFKLKVVRPLVPTQQRCELFILANGKTINIKNKILDKVKLMKPVEYKKITFKKNQVADVTVTFSESPLRFFVQLDLNQAILEVIMKCVEDYCTNSENKDILYTEDIVENMAVCAPYEDDKYYRGLIVDEPDTEGNINVFYVDYGNHDSVHYSKLRIMNNEMMSQFPTQAVECRLDIDPSLINNIDVINTFIELADGENFIMSVMNILPGNVLLVDLVDQNGRNLAEFLKETFGAKSSPGAYASPPKPPLQKSSSGNWREKNSTNTEGDFSSFRDERSHPESRDDRPRSDSNSNHFRTSHDDRVRGRNYESRRRDSDGVDTTDEAFSKKSGDFWGRDKGSRTDSGEPWRHDKFNSNQNNDRYGGPRDRNDPSRGTYRKRDDDNDTYNARSNQDDSRAGGGERRFDKGGQGGRSKEWETKTSDDEFGGGRPKRDGGFRGRRDEGGDDFSSRPPRRDDGFNDRPRRENRSNDGGFEDRSRRENRSNDGGFEDRAARRDNRSNDGGFNDRPRRDNRSNDGEVGNDSTWDNKNNNSWDKKPDNAWDKKPDTAGNNVWDKKTDDTWDNKEKSSNSGWGSDNRSNDRGGKRDFGNDRGGSFGDDSRGRRDGGFRKRDDNFSSNSDSRGPKTWGDDFGSSAVTLSDGFEKGSKIADAEYKPGQQVDSMISWFVKPVNFYIIPKDNADFRNLMEQIQSEYPTRKTLNTNDLSPNDHVVARDKDNVIYRATVLRTSPRGVVVTFVDYGNTETVGKNQVWAISPDHCVIPKQATLCSLHNIVSNDENGVWKATTEYDNYFGKDSFKATLVENVEQDGLMIWTVNLTDPDGQDVADQLIANNLALRKVVLASEELYDLDLLLNQTISVFTGAVMSSKKFFVHIEPDKTDHIGTYIRELTENPQNVPALPAENIVAGEFCLAPSVDESYYRALILSVNSADSQAHVSFIDYGDETDVSFDVLKTLPDYLKTYNAQAVQCCLYDSDSFTNDEDFVQNIEEKDFIIKVMNVQDNVLHVKLFNVEGAALPYPAESDETVPVVCAAPVLRPFENVVVSSVTAEKAFLQRPSDQHAVNELNNRLFEKYDNDVEQEKVAVEAGKFYVAKSGQFEAWYRCQLLEPESDKIFYIDYGNMEPIEGLLAIRPLDEVFYNVPACCFGVSTDADVSAESAEKLMTAIQEIVFKAVIKNTSTNAASNADLFAELRTAEGKTFADYVIELNSGSKRASEPEPVYNAFENWKPNESKNVIVSAMVSPIQFHLLLRDDADKLAKLQNDLENALTTVLPLVGTTDTLCAAKSINDSKWYRCYQADNIAVDCGLVIEPSVYKKLPAKFAINRDKYVVECRLDVASVTADWTETIDQFRELIKPENELVARLEATKDGKMIVDLISNGTSVTETLLNEGLAKYQGHNVIISHAVSLTEFYIQEESSQDELFEMLDKLKEGAEVWETIVPEVGQIVAAKFPDDEQWYRAKVISIVDAESNVLFIDYGNQSVCTEFRVLPDELSRLPKFASLCSAHPLPENAHELKEKFVAFVDENAETPFVVYYLSRHSEPMLVMLYFNEEIIEKYLVEHVEPEPPRPSLEFKNVSVVHINSPSSFYVQTETLLLDEVADRLDAVESSNEPLIKGMSVGTLYAAKFADDGVWYRAKAIAAHEVLFIDFGNTAAVEEVRNLPEDLKMIPFLAKHCAFKSPAGLAEWPQVATERFSELTCDGNTVFTMDIVEDGDPAFVQMIDDGFSVIDELYTLCQAELTAPSNENDKQTVIISYVTSLSEIWIQEQTPAFFELCDELTKVETFDALETSAAEPDTIVAALFDDDGVWYRAKVLQKLDHGCRVLFIDYGNESEVTLIKSLPEDLVSMPAFATRCRLSGLPDDVDTQWPASMLDKLREISENVESFVVLSKEVKEGVTYVTLQNDETTELSQQLIELHGQSAEQPQQASDVDDLSNEIPAATSDLPDQSDKEPQSSTADDMSNEIPAPITDQHDKKETEPSPNSACVVTEAVSESEFHLQNDTAKVEHVQSSIQSNEQSDTVAKSEDIEPVVGQVVSALDEDHNTSYRSKIDSFDETKESCHVTRIDFGGNFVAKKWSRLPADVTDIAPLAFKCSLSLPENLLNQKPDLSQKFLDIVKSQDATFTYKVVSSENDVTNVELFKDGVSVLDLLLSGEQSVESGSDQIESKTNVEDIDATDGGVVSQIVSRNITPTADVETINVDDNEAVIEPSVSSDNEIVQPAVPSLASTVEKVIDGKAITETKSSEDTDTKLESDIGQPTIPSLSIAEKAIDSETIAGSESLEDVDTSLENNIVESTVPSLSSIVEKVIDDEATVQAESPEDVDKSLENDIVESTVPSLSSIVEKVIDDETLVQAESLEDVNTSLENNIVESTVPSLSSVVEKVIDDEASGQIESPSDVDTDLDKSNDSLAENNVNQDDTSDVTEKNTNVPDDLVLDDDKICGDKSIFEVTEAELESKVSESEDVKVDDTIAREIGPADNEKIITKDDDVSCDLESSPSKSTVSEIDESKPEQTSIDDDTSLPESNVPADLEVDQSVEEEAAIENDDVPCDLKSSSSEPIVSKSKIDEYEALPTEATTEADFCEVEVSLPESNASGDVQIDETPTDEIVTSELEISSDSTDIEISDQTDEKISTNDDIISDQQTPSIESTTVSEVADDVKVEKEIDASDVFDGITTSKDDACSSEEIKRELDDTKVTPNQVISCEKPSTPEPAKSDDPAVDELGSDDSSNTVVPPEIEASAGSPASSSTTTEPDDEHVENDDPVENDDFNDEISKITDPIATTDETTEEECPGVAEVESSPIGSPDSPDQAESVYLSMDEDADNYNEKRILDVSLGSCSTFVGEIESESMLLNDSTDSNEKDSESKEESPSPAPSPATSTESSPKTKPTLPKSRTGGDLSSRKLVDGEEYIVTCVDNPGRFYVQKVSDGKFIKSMEKHLKATSEKDAVVDAKIDSMYAAKMGNNSWYRVTLTDSDPYHNYHVFCVDFGNDVTVNELFELPEELKAIASFAIRCGLPLSAHLNKWPLDVCIHFEEITLLNNPTFKLHVVPMLASGDVQMVNLTNTEFDVWKEIKEMCVKYEDENISEEGEQFLSPEVSP